MKRQPLIAGGLAVLVFCSLGTTIRAGGSQSRGQVRKGWPEQFGERKLYPCEYGFIYAAKKSGADGAKKVLNTVVKDLRQDGVTEPTDGLILVMDSHEKPPVDIARLIEAASKADAQKAGDKSKDPLKSIAETKKNMEKEGLDIDLLLSIAPVPIGPAILPEIAKEFPQDVAQQIGWCIIVPTTRCVKVGMKKMIDTMMKKEKVGLGQRLTMGALMPLVLNKSAEEVRKKQQALLYRLLVDAEKDLPEERKEQMHKAYKRKLGLDDKSKRGDNKKDKKEQ